MISEPNGLVGTGMRPSADAGLGQVPAGDVLFPRKERLDAL